MKLEKVDAKNETRNPKPYTLIIPALLLSLSFSGCLFLRPYTPSARLQPENQISTAYSLGTDSYAQNIHESSYDSKSGGDVYTDATDTGNGYFTGIGARIRLPESDFELGVNLSNFSGLSLDAKYAFTKPGQDVPLLALDAAVYIDGIQSFNAGLSFGPVLNIPLVQDGIFDIVLASYYQYYNYRQFGSYATNIDNGYAVTYAFATPQSSAYLYAGVEFALPNGNIIAPGISYTYFMGPNTLPWIFSAGVTIKTNAAPVKGQKAMGSLDPEAQTAYFTGAAERAIKNGDFTTASNIISRGLENFPGDYSLSLMQGFCMARLGKKQLAYKYYSDALTQDPDNINLKTSVRSLWEEIKTK